MKKLLTDFFPLLVFFAAFQFYDIYIATASAIVAAVVQVGALLLRRRRVDAMQWVTLALLLVFGGLTLLLRNDAFIKWKPSIVNWLFALCIIAPMCVGKPGVIQRLLGAQMQLPARVWRDLNFAWAAFFTLLGGLNVYVAFYYNLGADEAQRTQTWVTFKVFGLTGLSLAFVLIQGVWLWRHLRDAG